ncbi:MAG: GTP-binding protein [Promethearchaeota archaeon]|jgi:small GTP-binding protein
MSKLIVLENLLNDLINETQGLLAVIVLDLDGLIIAKQSISGFDEELIGAIMSILDQTMNRIKKYTETSFGCGTFSTNEFQLFYIELSRVIPAIFVLVGDPYSNIDQFIPYAYLTAETISLILSNQDSKTNIPKLNENGQLIFKSNNKSESNSSKVNKIVIVGPESAGKSALVQTYCNGSFNDLYKPTIGISIIEKKLQISKNHNLHLFLLDLGGIKSFAKIRKFYYKYSNAVLILFDYSREETFTKIIDWIEETNQFIKDKSIPILLIGNKIDLPNNHENLRSKAQDLARQYNFPFFETSALTGEGIDELFTYLISNLF